MTGKMTDARRSTLRTVWSLILPAVAAAGLCGCASGPRPARVSWPSMGTVAALSLAGADVRRLDEAAAAAQASHAALEARLSMFVPQSDIARLNAAAGAAAVQVSPAAAECLRLAIHYAAVSDGAFDVTVGPLVRAWGIHGGQVPVKPPDEAVLRDVLSRVGIRHLSLSNGWARLDKAGCSVDLGGIAKGYAADIGFDRLRGMGLNNLLVDMGGNMRCGGHPRRGQPWRIGVRNPFDRDASLGTLRLSDGRAVATSGNYERFVVIEGERYTHIVDPRTGWPVQGMAGVTVVCTNAVEADAMSTSLFVLGLEKSKVALQRVAGCEALFVPDRQPIEIWITPGLARIFTPEPEYAPSVRLLK
jgi:FAD:protein FMN transferase